MSIEFCSFLRPSLKAKLQDSGVLFIDELLTFFYVAEPSAAGAGAGAEVFANGSPARPTQRQGSPSPRVQPHVAALRCDDNLATSLRARVPTLAKEEVFDLIASTTAFLADIAKRSALTSGRPRMESTQPSHNGAPPSARREFLDNPAVGVPSAVHGGTRPPLFTVRTLGDIERSRTAPGRRRPTHVTTFSRSLDKLLGAPDPRPGMGAGHDGSAASAVDVSADSGKGVEVGKLTEVSGPPGVGKTQLMLQLAVSCAMPVELGGLAGDCLYLDTEGGFVYERFTDIALAAVALVKDLVRRLQPAHGGSPSLASSSSSSLPAPALLERLSEKFTVASVLSRVHYVRVADAAALLAALHSVPAWAAQMALAPPADGHARGAVEDSPPTASSSSSSLLSSPSQAFALRMLIVDSIAGPFRAVEVADPLSMRRRSRLIMACGGLLQQHASLMGLAVVVSNQVTTRVARRGALGAPVYAGKRLRPLASVRDGDGEVEGNESDEDAEAPGRRGVRADGDDCFTYLVPSLGDGWAMHASTRLLLSFHHYAFPYAAAGGGGKGAPTASGGGPLACERAMCPEDVVFSRATPRRGDGIVGGSTYQHRVARLTKHDTNPRGECCFAISGKGIRDMGR